MTTPITITDDPYTSANLTDPYELYTHLREAGALVEVQKYGWLACARDKEVREILVNATDFISGAGVGPKNFFHEENWRSPGILESDGDRHHALRAALDTVISPRTVRGMRPGFRAAADRITDQLVTSRSFDAADDFAVAYPLEVFGDLIGIGREGRARYLLPHGQMHFSTFGPVNERHLAFWAAGEGSQEWVTEQCRRENLDPDGLGAKIWTLVDEGTIPPEFATILVRSLLSAGLDTTVLTIGVVLSALLRNPNALNRCINDPSLVPFAIDEALRWESPFFAFFRTTAREVELAGQVLPEGTKVQVYVASANRDPEKWGPDADKFDLDRDAGGHLAFGRGVHQCVGQPITRLETTVALQTLFGKISAMELTGNPVPFVHNTLKGWTSLPVTVTPAQPHIR